VGTGAAAKRRAKDNVRLTLFDTHGPISCIAFSQFTVRVLTADTPTGAVGIVLTAPVMLCLFCSCFAISDDACARRISVSQHSAACAGGRCSEAWAEHVTCPHATLAVRHGNAFSHVCRMPSQNLFVISHINPIRQSTSSI